jgi:hypothetical protein
MTTNKPIITTQGSYESKISFLRGEEYRVAVTYNYGHKISFLRSYYTLRGAKMAAKRELKKIAD